MSVSPRLQEVRPVEPTPRPRPRVALGTWWIAGVVAILVFWIAYENGGSGLTARSIVGIALWWVILVGVGFGLLPRAPLGRTVVVAGGLLAAFAVHTFVSAFWAPNAAKAFNEFNRIVLYLGLYLLVAIGVRKKEIGRWTDGLGIGLVATAIVALISRLFPDLFSERGLPEFLPGSTTRLSFPVGYWNGLGILMGLTVPFCLRSALVGRDRWVRSLALLPAPVIAAVIYLTSSRGGVATAIVASFAFVAATDRRWEAVGALLAASLGAAAAVSVLLARDTLVNGPLHSDAASSQGRSAAFLLLGCCLLSAGGFAGGARLLGGRWRPTPRLDRAALAMVIAAAVVAVLALHPVRRVDAFKEIPVNAPSSSSGDFVRAHLLSGNGSGRWQFWSAAVDEFESAPVVGRGAASYQSWWAKHASFTYFLRNAHSLYLEALGELGIIGFLLITALVVSGLVIAVKRVKRAPVDERPTRAALMAVFTAFAFAAMIDWVWQLTIVTAVAIISLGLLTGVATTAVRGPHPAADDWHRSARAVRFAAATAALASGWLLICAQAIPWLSSMRLGDSQAAVRRGDGDAAFSAAADARRIQPWSPEPYLQLALVEEASGHLARARQWIAEAIARDREDWRLWLVAARLETKVGAIGAAQRSLARAADLNPRSPLFSDAPK